MSTEAQSVADIVRASQRHETNANPHAEEVLIFPDKTITALEKYAERPRRKRGVVKLEDGASFAAYVNNHVQPGTAIFGRATLAGGSFEAVLDYHEGNADPASEKESLKAQESRPAWGNHRAKYELATTPEWQRWIGLDGKPIDQLKFAEFLEDSRADILKPTSIQMLEFASTLQIKNDVAFTSNVKLSNGQVQLSYVETIEHKNGQGGNVDVPTEFTLALQPFAGAPRYEITARLRTKLNGRAVAFTYLLDKPHKVIETAFRDVRALIAEATGLPVLLGSVESIGL